MTASAGVTAADQPDGATAARDAGLCYVSDAEPGIRRLRRGRGFDYVDATGARIADDATLRRIRSIAVPPAWTQVWICPRPDGHLQATGRDARGRKQYRYHPRFRAAREEAKFEHLIGFARRLPRIRARVERDLARPGMPREKVLALVVRLLESTLIRVGNEEYARLDRSFGLTTLRDRHATVRGSSVRFRFRGKSGKLHEVGIRDRRLARLVARCQELSGQELFQYLDETGEPRPITSGDVNGYLRDISGLDVTAKDFRTWAGTVLAFRALSALECAEAEGDARRRVAGAVAEVASRLGNTSAVCRRSYIHPAVVDAYLEGSIGGATLASVGERPAPRPSPREGEGAAVAKEAAGAEDEAAAAEAAEAAVLRLLARRARQRSPRPADRPAA